MYDAEYFELLAHGGNGNLDLDTLMLSVSYTLTGFERPIPCCPPKKKVLIARSRHIFNLRVLALLFLLLCNALLIYCGSELISTYAGIENVFIKFGLGLFVTAVVIFYTIFLQCVVFKNCRPSRVLWYVLIVDSPMFLACCAWLGYRILF